MTKPTRAQDQACDHLAEALLLTATAARLDGRSRFGGDDLRSLVSMLLKATSCFDADQIVLRALDLRAKALGLPKSTGELLMLVGGDVSPLDALRLDDESFRARTADAEADLEG